MRMKDKLVICDLDGTLFDTRNLNFSAYKFALAKFGFDLDKEYFFKECNGRHYKEFLPIIMNNDLTHMEEVHALKKKAYSDFLDKAIENTHLFNIISSLKSTYYLAIVTTASRKNCEEILNKFKHLDLFDLIVSGEDVNNKKPDPEGFLKAINHYKIKEEDCIIFEDSQVGILAASKTNADIFVVKGYS